MSKFMKSLCKIAIPVTLQSMLQSSFSIIDQVMVGQLGEAAIAAVGLCGNFTLIFTVVLGAVGTVAGILIAQFIGAEDEAEAWRGLSVSLVSGLAIAALFWLAEGLLPGQILSLYTKDDAIIRAGAPYFRIISFTAIPMALNTILSAWLRCREHASIPFLASLIGVLVNTGCNYVLIFGKLGMSALGVTGAAIATLLSQLVSLFLVCLGFVYCIKKDHDTPLFSLHLKRLTMAEYAWMVCPIIVSEFLWSLGQNVESAVYGHLGTSDLAAYSLTCPIQGLVVGALSGLSAAAGVLIGKRLGSGEYAQAYRESCKIMIVGFLGAALVAVGLGAFADAYTGLYRVEANVGELGRQLLYVFALYAPFKVENMILGGGIIRSGGNTKIIMIIDIVGTWCIAIPLCLLAAYVFSWGIVGVYALLTSEEIIRLLATLLIFRKKTWMVNLAQE